MKAAPVLRALAPCSGMHQALVHTGQHYDAQMSDVFFRELGMPAPDVNLEVGSGSQAWQTAEVMKRFEPVVLERQPAWVLVYGDVNSTVAAALVCAKLGIRVAHVEAGLRSFDRTMPEELNRLVTDQLADLLLTPSCDANDNLLREGIHRDKIHLVGNVMIDTVVRLLPRAQEGWPRLAANLGLGVPSRPYVLVTLHRPANVDNADELRKLMSSLAEVAHEREVIFPVHPRTRQRLGTLGLECGTTGLHLLEPLGYLDFLALEAHAELVITDSGGVQEETTFLHVPCLTVRNNTERPVTIHSGTNTLIGSDTRRLLAAVRAISERPQKRVAPELWDGKASERIAEIVLKVGRAPRVRGCSRPSDGSPAGFRKAA
jgi:UDP-N-acetylglucosamine 2-epimerase (non-hydrolysing)